MTKVGSVPHNFMGWSVQGFQNNRKNNKRGCLQADVRDFSSILHSFQDSFAIFGWPQTSISRYTVCVWCSCIFLSINIARSFSIRTSSFPCFDIKTTVECHWSTGFHSVDALSPKAWRKLKPSANVDRYLGNGQGWPARERATIFYAKSAIGSNKVGREDAGTKLRKSHKQDIPIPWNNKLPTPISLLLLFVYSFFLYPKTHTSCCLSSDLIPPYYDSLGRNNLHT